MVGLPSIEVASADPQYGFNLWHGVCERFERRREEDHVSYAGKEAQIRRQRNSMIRFFVGLLLGRAGRLHGADHLW